MSLDVMSLDVMSLGNNEFFHILADQVKTIVVTNATKYMGTIKSALNSGGRVVKVASKGMVVVPIVLGIGNVIDAPQERKMKTLFEEGFGIIGGYGGALFGAQVIRIRIRHCFLRV